MKEPFTLTFQATESYSGLGDLAINDVSFINCGLPQMETSSCQTDKFR